MTTAAGLAAVPVLAVGQANTRGSSMMPQTTQTTPQTGPTSGVTIAPQGNQFGTSEQNQRLPNPAQGAASDRQTPPNMQAQGQPASPQTGSSNALGNPAASSGNVVGTSGGTASGGTAATTTTTTTTTPAPRTTVVTTSRPDFTVDPMGLRDARRASKVIGSTVYGENNDSIGSVDDIMIPQHGGDPVAVLSVGGFLGIGAKLVAVPYEQLRFDPQRERWMLPGATKDALTALPTFAYDADRRERDAAATTGTNAPAAARGGARAGGGAATNAAPPAGAPARTQ
jgi:hypothetical protein